MTGERRTVFYVDDSPTNLSVGKNVLADDYVVFTLTSAQKLFELLEKKIPDLILLDVEMPDIDGYEALEKMRENRRYDGIPVIFATGTEDEREEYGFELGAYDYVYKPFSAASLLKRIANCIELSELRKKLRGFEL
ncbi:hypothetical protein FACS18949_14970 [Clostridia bacterium]|nr:hypothetical protein FACS18949_14970 [Clostridia bacterium]